jgi:hypothetical protein
LWLRDCRLAKLNVVEDFHEEVGALAYMPCSTRTGFNVDKVIDMAVALVFKQFLQNNNVDKKKCVIV